MSSTKGCELKYRRQNVASHDISRETAIRQRATPRLTASVKSQKKTLFGRFALLSGVVRSRTKLANYLRKHVCGVVRHRIASNHKLIPTLSRSFVVVPFRLGLVWLSVLSTLPPNPSACPRVSVWDKPWDKFANYFETASPQFHFCPGDKNGLVLRP